MRNPILQKKRAEHEKVFRKFGISQNKSVGIVLLKDTKILSHLVEGLKTLSVSFVVIGEGKSENNVHFVEKIEDESLIGYDFIVVDSEASEIEKYMKSGVVPIISKKNYLSSLLSEFNPIKNEGNAFIYEQDSEWQVFYALCRYLENSKFSFDNQNLVNNVTKI